MPDGVPLVAATNGAANATTVVPDVTHGTAAAGPFVRGDGGNVLA